MRRATGATTAGDGTAAVEGGSDDGEFDPQHIRNTSETNPTAGGHPALAAGRMATVANILTYALMIEAALAYFFACTTFAARLYAW